MKLALMLIGVGLAAAWTITLIMGGGFTPCDPGLFESCR
jgi:hypothetical protein